MSQTITRLYNTYIDAKSVVNELEALGVPHNDISIIANDHGNDSHTKASQDAGIGSATGAVIGGVGGLLAGIGMLAIPGIGPVVAAGWLAATAAGAGTGAIVGGAAGGLIGALQKEGVSRDDAEIYSEGVRRGGSLVSAKVDDYLIHQAEAVMNHHGVVNPATRGQTYRDSGWSSFDETAMPYTPQQIVEERNRHDMTS